MGEHPLKGSSLLYDSQFLLVSLTVHTKQVRENAVMEDHSIAEEKVKGISKNSGHSGNNVFLFFLSYFS